MAYFYLTAATNFGTLTGKAGNDTYEVAGGSLTIDQDVRYGPNTSPTTGPFGTLVVNSALGGSITIDGRAVILIAYNSGTGNVPAAGTTISQGGVSAELLCVMSALNAAPTTAGSAMPTSGFIKCRNKTGGNFASGALTGIGANSRRADRVGWIEIIGDEGQAVSIPRLGSLSILGEWFRPMDSTGVYIDTDGAANQQIQLPAHVANTYFPGVWIETAVGSGVYAEWPNAANYANASIETTEKGRMVWITSGGLMRIGHDGTNTVGRVPVSGCKIRIPNVYLGNTNTTVGYAANSVPDNSASNRFEFNFNSNGAGTIDKASSAWSNTFEQAYSLAISNSAFLCDFRARAASTPISVTHCIVADRDTSGSNGDKAAFTQMFAGGAVEDCVFSRIRGDGSYVYTVRFEGTGLSVKRCRAHTIPLLTDGACYTFYTVGTDSLYQDCESIGGTWLKGSLSSVKFKGTKYASVPYGTVPSSPNIAVWLGGGIERNVTHDGLTWLTAAANSCHPNQYLLQFNDGAFNLKLRNIGTRAAPLDMGSSNVATRLTPMGYQVTGQKVAVQNVFTTATSGSDGAFGSDVGFTKYDLQKVSSLDTDPLILKQSDAALRAIRTPDYPIVGSAAVGLHWADIFLTDTTGAIMILLTDPIAATASQASVRVGTPKFTGSGALIIKNVNDEYEWIMKYFAQGHTALSSLTITYPGTANYDVQFKYDVGAGWSAWQTCDTTNLAAVTIDPAIGVRLGLRLKCTTANPDPITVLRIQTATTTTAQDAVDYPLDPVAITVTGVVAGSRMLLTRTDTDEVLHNDIVTGTSFVQDFDIVDVPIRIELRNASGTPAYKPWFTVGTVTTEGFTTTALQERDDI